VTHAKTAGQPSPLLVASFDATLFARDSRDIDALAFVDNSLISCTITNILQPKYYELRSFAYRDDAHACPPGYPRDPRCLTHCRVPKPALFFSGAGCWPEHKALAVHPAPWGYWCTGDAQ
jgi:hypothetical protein